MSDGWSNRISILGMCCLAKMYLSKQRRNCSETRLCYRIESDVDFGGVAAGIRRSALKVRHTYIHHLQPHSARSMLLALERSKAINRPVENKLYDISFVNGLTPTGNAHLLASLGLECGLAYME